jgi:hypothetical protein
MYSQVDAGFFLVESCELNRELFRVDAKSSDDGNLCYKMIQPICGLIPSGLFRV